MLEGDAPVPAAGQVWAGLEALLTAARAAGAVVVHVQNDGSSGEPDEPETDGWRLVFPAIGGELVVRKDVPDTLVANPDLAWSLREQGVDRVVVAGMQSEYCVEAISRGALGHGFEVLFPLGGCRRTGMPWVEGSRGAAAMAGDFVDLDPAGAVSAAVGGGRLHGPARGNVG
jgi:nicotinamidase-related amidase